MSMSGHFTSCGRDAVLRAWRCFGVGLAMALAACGQPAAPLAVGLNTWVGYDPLVVARDLRLVDARQVKVVELSSSSETLRHFRNGLLEAAALTLDEVLRLSDEGIDVRVVALLDASSGADVVMASPALESLQQLAGARVAVEDSTVGALMLERLLQEAGVSRSAISVLPMEATQHLTALNSQQVDVAVSYEPVAGLLRSAGYHALFDSSQMPGDIVDVLVVRADVLATRPRQVDALLRAWAQGLQALQSDRDSHAQWLAPAVELTPKAYLHALDRLQFHPLQDSWSALSGEPPALQSASASLVQLLLASGLISQAPAWHRLVDAGPLRRVLAESTTP